MPELERLGADEVIPEEFETSIEIFARLLRVYGVERDEIHRQLAEIRMEGYEMRHSATLTAGTRSEG